MKKHHYKGITFAENWNGTFDSFKAEFENIHVFQGIPQKERLVEMKKVFNDLVSLNKAQDKLEAKEEK